MDDIASHLTFGKIFQQAGYVTAHAGKWQLSGKHPNLIRECGFDEYCMWAYKHNLPKADGTNPGGQTSAGRGGQREQEEKSKILARAASGGG